MPRIAIIGTTSFGITLGMVLARSGTDVSLWARTEREAIELAKAGPNPLLTNGACFPPKLAITSSLSDAFANARAVILAVPSQSMRHNMKCIAGEITKTTLNVGAAKGGGRVRGGGPGKVDAPKGELSDREYQKREEKGDRQKGYENFTGRVIFILS